MLRIRRFWRYVTDNIVAPTQPTAGQLMSLASPLGLPLSIRRHAASVIAARIQLLSVLFFVLVPLCGVIDLVVFPWPQALALLVLRLAAGVVFFQMAKPRPLTGSHPYKRALGMLACMLVVPCLFYLAALRLTGGLVLTDAQFLMMQIYALMPTVVLGGLAIFPLSALEVLLFALPALVTALMGMTMGDAQQLSWAQHGATLWFMALMTGIAMFSSMSQLHYMKSLVHRANTDPLTDALTRRSGVESLERLFMQSANSETPLALAFIDIDHFKAINDRFGHDAGDRALCSLVRSLRGYLRSSDVLVRWGGEEFVIILPNMSVSQLPYFIERLRQGGLGRTEDGTAIMASVGVAERMHDEVLDWPTLIELADQRMYRAKNEGRARVILPDDTTVSLARPVSTPVAVASSRVDGVPGGAGEHGQ
ncbi:GGDEF domain-containing protein [Kerstersia gyiorum]|uniref:GGDEF domain-containing protein n=1 Tax=Kerstersia gyiorum TaxID=206506 RepID=UPI0021504369|nr:GGDEF domain-containing protein [Kerstersia gyiorum]MCR4159932.1 GGDEF domain-containing protein [Kerstersia gyiorum]